MAKIGTSTPAPYEAPKYSTPGELYTAQELFGTLVVNPQSYTYQAKKDSDDAANMFQKDIGVGGGDKPYTLRTQGAILATTPQFPENAVFAYTNAKGEVTQLQAQYIQKAGANTNTGLTAGAFAGDANTETGYIEYFNLAPITERLGELDTDIAKAKANIVGTNARSGESIKKDIAELEAQQTEAPGIGSLFSKRDGEAVIPVPYTTPITVGGVKVGFAVDYAQKSAAIAKEIEGLRGAANAARAAWDGQNNQTQKINAKQELLNKANEGLEAMRKLNNPALAEAIKTQEETVQTLKGELAKLKENDSPVAKKIEAHIADLQQLAQSYKGKKPDLFVAEAYQKDYNDFARATNEKTPLKAAQEKFLETAKEPGWFQVTHPVMVGKGKNMRQDTELLYGHVPPTLDGVKAK